MNDKGTMRLLIGRELSLSLNFLQNWGAGYFFLDCDATVAPVLRYIKMARDEKRIGNVYFDCFLFTNNLGSDYNFL